ncbi:MAG: hypothetical protein AAFO58_10240 [Pseudomonadota bacterium]
MRHLAKIAAVSAVLLGAAAPALAQWRPNLHSALEDMIRVCATSPSSSAVVTTLTAMGYVRPGAQDFARVRNLQTDNDTLRLYVGSRDLNELEAWRLSAMVDGSLGDTELFWTDSDRRSLISIRTDGDMTACDYFGHFTDADAHFVAMISMVGSVAPNATGHVSRIRNSIGGAPFEMVMYSMDDILAPALKQPPVLGPSSLTIVRG